MKQSRRNRERSAREAENRFSRPPPLSKYAAKRRLPADPEPNAMSAALKALETDR